MTPPSTDSQTSERPLEQFSSQISRWAGLNDTLPLGERRRGLITMLVGALIALAGGGIYLFDTVFSADPYWGSPVIGIGSIGSWLLSLALVRLRQVSAASAVITLFLWSMPTFFILSRGGLSEMSGNPFVLTVLFGFASMGGRGLAGSLTLCIATVLGISALEASGGIPPSTAPQPPLLMYAISDITVLVLTAAMVEYGVRRTTLHLSRVRQERARLAEAEKRQERQIHLALALGQMGHLLLERDRLDTVCRLAAERLVQLLKADAVWVGQRHSRAFETLAAMGFDEHHARIAISDLSELDRLTQSGMVEVTADSEQWRPLLPRQGRGTGLIFALTDASETTGLLFIAGSPSTPFNPDQRAFLEAVAGLLSAAIARESARTRQAHAQKMEVVGRMASGVAHDFNNLLMVVEAVAFAMQKGEFKPENLSQDLSDVSVRGSLMTRRILAFTKPESEDKGTLDVDQVITELLPLFQRLMGPEIELDQELDASGACILASRGAFEQILMNLAVNAADAMPNGGSFTLRTRRITGNLHTGRVEVSVADTGSGMDEATLQRAFQPFFTTKNHGTGLGLATVRDCVEEANGSLHADSTPGSGTTFTMRFPLRNPRPQTPVSIPPNVSEANRETVLLVDDDRTVRRALRRLIEVTGYRVVEASDGVEALERVQEHPEIKAVVTDLKMPNMGGVELIRRLSDQQPHLPCIAITGWAEEGAETVIEAGAVTLLRKPVQIPRLMAALAEAVYGEAAEPASTT